MKTIFLLCFSVLILCFLGCQSYKLPTKFPTEAGPAAKLDTLMFFALADSINISHAFDSGSNMIHATLQMNHSAFHVDALFSNSYIFDRQGKLLFKDVDNFSSYFNDSISYKSIVETFLESKTLTMEYYKQRVELDFFGQVLKREKYRLSRRKQMYTGSFLQYTAYPLERFKCIICNTRTIGKNKRQEQLLLYNPKRVRSHIIYRGPVYPKTETFPFVNNPAVGTCDGRSHEIAYTTIHAPIFAFKKGRRWTYKTVRSEQYDYLEADSIAKVFKFSHWFAYTGLFGDFQNKHFALCYSPAENGKPLKWGSFNILLYDANTHTFFEQTVPPLCMVFPFIQDKKMYILKLSYPQKIYVWELRSR